MRGKDLAVIVGVALLASSCGSNASTVADGDTVRSYSVEVMYAAGNRCEAVGPARSKLTFDLAHDVVLMDAGDDGSLDARRSGDVLQFRQDDRWVELDLSDDLLLELFRLTKEGMALSMLTDPEATDFRAFLDDTSDEKLAKEGVEVVRTPSGALESVRFDTPTNVDPSGSVPVEVRELSSRGEARDIGDQDAAELGTLLAKEQIVRYSSLTPECGTRARTVAEMDALRSCLGERLGQTLATETLSTASVWRACLE